MFNRLDAKCVACRCTQHCNGMLHKTPNVKLHHGHVFLAHLAYIPMSLCNHDLSVMCHCHLSLVSSLLSLVSSSVYSCPSDSIAHINFIFCRYMYICPKYMYKKYWINVTYTFEIAAILAKF